MKDVSSCSVKSQTQSRENQKVSACLTSHDNNCSSQTQKGVTRARGRNRSQTTKYRNINSEPESMYRRTCCNATLHSSSDMKICLWRSEENIQGEDLRTRANKVVNTVNPRGGKCKI